MKRKALGQHYLIDQSIVKKIVDVASIENNESLLEIGCGKGAITKEILSRGFELVGYEIDRNNYNYLLRELLSKNFKLFLGDAFQHDLKFDVLISSIPYSQSSRFVEWLCTKKYKRAVIVLQSDFVDKLTAEPGSKLYRAISVISQICCMIRSEFEIPRDAFFPKPRVGSRVVTLFYRRKLSREEMIFIKRLFSYRKKKVSTALRSLGCAMRHDFADRRVFSLNPEEVFDIISEVV